MGGVRTGVQFTSSMVASGPGGVRTGVQFTSSMSRDNVSEAVSGIRTVRPAHGQS